MHQKIVKRLEGLCSRSVLFVFHGQYVMGSNTALIVSYLRYGVRAFLGSVRNGIALPWSQKDNSRQKHSSGPKMNSVIRGSLGPSQRILVPAASQQDCKYDICINYKTPVTIL